MESIQSSGPRVLIPGTATNLENVSARRAGRVKVEHTPFGHACCLPPGEAFLPSALVEAATYLPSLEMGIGIWAYCTGTTKFPRHIDARSPRPCARRNHAERGQGLDWQYAIQASRTARPRQGALFPWNLSCAIVLGRREVDHASNREDFFLPTDSRDNSDPILRFYLVTKGPRNSMVVE